jgi:hypothetical protein
LEAQRQPKVAEDEAQRKRQVSPVEELDPQVEVELPEAQKQWEAQRQANVVEDEARRKRQVSPVEELDPPPPPVEVYSGSPEGRWLCVFVSKWEARLVG